MPAIQQFFDLSQPVSQAIFLVAVSLLLLCFRHYRWAATACLLSVAWVALCATPAFAMLLQQGLEDQNPRIDASRQPTADAIVVLGGGNPLWHDETIDQDANDLRMTRTGFALELYRHRKAPIIVASGGDGEAIQIAGQIERGSVPTRVLRVESRSTDTHENATYSAAILNREGLNRILLVTSAWDMPRAAAAFRRQGLDVIAAPSFEHAGIPSSSMPWLPQAILLRLMRASFDPVNRSIN